MENHTLPSDSQAARQEVLSSNQARTKSIAAIEQSSTRKSTSLDPQSATSSHPVAIIYTDPEVSTRNSTLHLRTLLL